MLPVLLQFKDISIYSYPFMVGLAWGLGYHFFREEKLLKNNPFFFFSLFLFSWLGAKMAYLLNPVSDHLYLLPNFWLGGGFVFLGGLFCALIYLVVLYKLKKISFTDIENLIPPLLIGHALGRIGCFLAGCCYGSETHLPISVFIHGEHRHPVQLYEALGLIFLFVILNRKKYRLISVYLIGYGFLRFGLEFLRADPDRGFWASLSTSQWASLILIISGSYIHFYLKPSQTVK